MKKQNNTYIPIVPIRGTVVFPGTVTPIMVGRQLSVSAVEFASMHDKKIFLVAQQNPAVEDPSANDLFKVGTLCKLVQVMRFPNNMMKILVEGISRGRVEKYRIHRDYIDAKSELYIQGYDPSSPKTLALSRKALELFKRYVTLHPSLPDQLSQVVEEEQKILHRMADIISAQLEIDFSEKQKLLECNSLDEQLDLIVKIITREIEILQYKHLIDRRATELMEKGQREYYLRQQMEAIRTELGELGSVIEEDVAEFKQKMEKLNAPNEVKDAIMKELNRLSRMQATSPEATVSRSYIEWLLDLPWAYSTPDNFDINNAREILDKDHYGLEKVKERILEQIAVLKLSQNPRGPLLCFVGPPGVGKTSVAKSVARALGRKFVRASLGGLHDEAEIRGHRRTYIGALPGKIIQGIRRAGSRNPVFLLDEIDKIGRDFRGDPAAALMEVLDPDQNFSFMDNYIELPYDLSKVLFITTANTTDGIPTPLLDRMEILRLPGYLDNEKVEIAMNYLIPKLVPEMGLQNVDFTFTRSSIEKVISLYTREAGVRELERQISAVMRKIAASIAENESPRKFIITHKNVKSFLGVQSNVSLPVPQKLIPGEALGLAWTASGGELLRIEVLLSPGDGKVEITGRLGDVMKESVKAALSLVKSRAKTIGYSLDLLSKSDIHIHFPEGAVPKDGPSAGVPIVLAMSSALVGKALPNNIAATGEITLSGRILSVGGLAEKLLAARRYGLKEIFLPKENKSIMSDIKPELTEGLKLIFVESIDEVLARVFKSRKQARKK